MSTSTNPKTNFIMPDSDVTVTPNWVHPYLNITDAGAVSANATLKAMGTNTPVDLVIPSEINGIEVTSISEQAFYDCRSLTSVTIPASVTTIGTNAFGSSKSLGLIYVNNLIDSITGAPWGATNAIVYWSDPSYFNITDTGIISASDTLKAMTADTPIDLVIPSELGGIKVTSIGPNAFYGCSSLTSITIPNSVTSIANSAFALCRSLTSITIPNSIRTIGNTAFLGCSSLASITIPNSVTSIGGGAFNSCTALTTININKPQDSITGAPWFAPKATVYWLG